ncbi:oxidoreductase [Lactovum miscens]|uniref:Oxidoreductase n=1 Tax=Lactovum miscens TaxID=190387 RepID=A0A841C9E8_9LACT|nr:oxidoreductase [Lactovum miscens]MBB5888212.1 hypothetical protein [Lactovum miscens]
MILKIGFIGFGKSATRYHLPYVLLRKNIQVKTILALHLDEEMARPYREKGIAFTTDIDELLNDPEISLVSICTPPSSHYSLAKQVIEAGKSVVVEKPFCDSVEHARELFALAHEHGVLVTPYQNRRFDGDFLAVKQVVEQGFLGDILEVESHIDYYRPGTTAKQGPKEVGAFYGLGIHQMDRMISLFGRPNTVTYDIRNNETKDDQAVDNYFDVDLHYDNALKVKVKTNYTVASNYPRFRVVGTQGTFIKYGEDQQENDLKAGIMPETEGFGEDSPMLYGIAKYRNSNGDWIEKQIKTPNGDYGRFYDSLYDTLVNGADRLITEEQAITAIEILENGFTAPSPSVYHLEKI